jgi:hypothetical protein
MENVELAIAVTAMRNVIPADKSLEDRIAFAFRYAREHEASIFWMSHRVTDDLLFKTALGAVMEAATEDEREQITHSLKPLKALSALLSGVPVDLSAVDMENLLPLRKLFDESKSPA